jgi:hypothetical protein
MIRRGEIDVRLACAAHIFGVGFGMATIVSLVPAAVTLMRMFT